MFSYIIIDNTCTFDCTLCHFHFGFKGLLKIQNFFSQYSKAHSIVRLLLESLSLNMVFAKSSSRLTKGLIKFGLRGKASSPPKYNGIFMLVPVIFRIKGHLSHKH